MFTRSLVFLLVSFAAFVAPEMAMSADAALIPFTVRKLYVVPLVSDQSELVLFDTRPVGQKQQVRVTYATPVRVVQFESTGDGVYRLMVPTASGQAFVESEYGFVSAYTNIMGATISAVFFI